MKHCCCCKSPYFIFRGPSQSKMRPLCGCEDLKREDLSTKTIQQWCGWINVEVYSLAGGLLAQSLSVEHCKGVCISVRLCLHVCIYTDAPPTDYRGLYNVLTTCTLKGATWWLAVAASQMRGNPA